MFRLLSPKRFAIAGMSSPVFGPILLFASVSIPPTASTAAARTFQLGSDICLTSFSVILLEMSVRGSPPSEVRSTASPPPSGAPLTLRVTFTAGTSPVNGFLANSASNDFNCASLRSARKFVNPGPKNPCNAPSTFPALDLHNGFGIPRHSLHHLIVNATSTTDALNSFTTATHQESASAVTFGFLCPAVLL